MAKTKGKSKAAASNVGVRGKVASGNDMIADSAPSESVKISEAANTFLDKSVEINNEEETNNGPDEPEEVDEVEETKDDLDEAEEVDEVEETKGGLDEPEEVDEVEEAKDGLDPTEEEDEETTDDDDDDDDESKEGENEKDTKKDGTDIVAEGENVVGEKVVGGKAQGAKVEVEKVEEKGVKDNTNGEDVKDDTNGGNVPGKKTKTMRRKRKAAANAAAVASNDAGKSQNADKQGTSAADKKDLKMADGMGLVFMCNARTKQDCFRYKVLGLPASKKEMVTKIYKGMRLFLFDTDLKLMYGIYKAAGPGGYNIEPKAFKSAFPSQVHFSVLNDCFPLPEEKFKTAIKENYYGKNKFDCQLSPEQVKNLCKLFQKAGKIPKERISGHVIAEPQLPSVARDRRKTGKAVREDPVRTSSTLGRPKNRGVIRAEPEWNSFARGRKRARHERGGRRDDSIPLSGDRHRFARREIAYPSPRGGDHSYARRREAYASPPPPRTRALPPPPPTYAYSRQRDEYYYRRDPPPPQPRDPRDYSRDPPPLQPLDPRDYHRAVELEARPRQPIEYRDASGSVYREPIPYREAFYASSASYAPRPSLAPDGHAPPAVSLATPAYYRY